MLETFLCCLWLSVALLVLTNSSVAGILQLHIECCDSPQALFSPYTKSLSSKVRMTLGCWAFGDDQVMTVTHTIMEYMPLNRDSLVLFTT